MASGAFKWYGNGLKAILNKEIDFNSDAIKLMLASSSYTPSQAHDYKDDVTNEVTGTNWAAGGVTLANCTIAFTAADSWGTSRANSTAYAVGDLVRPATGNGHVYRCIVAGTSGGSIPTWPTVAGQTVTDGGATWAEAGVGVVVLDADDVSVANATLTGGRVLVVYDSTPGTDATRPLIGYATLDSDLSPNAGTVAITFAATGLLTLTPGA